PRYRRRPDQQECARRCAHRRRCRQSDEGNAAFLEDAAAQSRCGRARIVVETDRNLARKKFAVVQHQRWAAQRFKVEDPNHWMTSGGLGTMGYGLPASIGVQMAHPDALVID